MASKSVVSFLPTCCLCKAVLHRGNAYYPKRLKGKPHPRCKTCDRYHVIRQQWKKRTPDEILAEMNNLQARIDIFRKLLWEKSIEELRSGDRGSEE